jgi:hypothetical protein
MKINNSTFNNGDHAMRKSIFNVTAKNFLPKQAAILLILLIGFIGVQTITSCSGDDGSGDNGTNPNSGGSTALNGTWQRSRTIGGYYQIKVDGNNWEYYDGASPVAKGTWSSNPAITASSTGTITLLMTHIYEGVWRTLPSEYNSIKTNTATFSLNASGTTFTLSNSSLNHIDQWSKLEGTYTKEGGGGNSSSSTPSSSSSSVPSGTPSSSSGGGGGNAGTYIITGSGTSFTATKGGATVGTANRSIVNVINAIRTDANSANCTIQFGDGTNELDVGNDGVSLNNIGGNWGIITLTGKITAQRSDIIIVSYDVSINSTADIGRISSGPGTAIKNQGTGTVTINGGRLSMTGYEAAAISNTGSGTIVINNGTVSAMGESNYAIKNGQGGSVTINGGTISSTGSAENMAAYNNAILNAGTLNITGGTVTAATAGTSIYATSYAVYNASGGTVNITNGTVTATGTTNYAIYNESGTVTITTPPTIIDKSKTSGTITWLP